MYPILARTRWFFIYSYTAVLTVGVLLSLLWAYKSSKETAVHRWFDALLLALAAGLLVGRLSFIGSQWAYYVERPSTLNQLWQGGFTYHGVWIGALISLSLWAVVSKQPLRPLLTLIAPAIPLLALFGWGACWLEGCAYGTQTTFGPFSANLPDHLGVFAVRYRTQLAGMILNSLLLAWTIRQVRIGAGGQNGRLFWQLTLFTTLIHTSLTFFRGDEVFQISSLRLDTLLDFGMVVFCLVLLQYGRYQSNRAYSK